MSRIDEFVIDELVAGNLHGERYRQVIRALDQQEDGWKDLAVAFLQEQALTRDLSLLASEDAAWSADRQDEAKRQEVSLASSAALSVGGAAGSNDRLELLSKLTSIAALLLISFTIGWFGSGMRSNSRAVSNGPAVSSGNPSDLVVSGGGLNQASPAVENDGAGIQFVGDQMVPLDVRPPEFLREVQRQGLIELETTDAIIPVTKDGATMLIPVQQYRIRPKAFSY